MFRGSIKLRDVTSVTLSWCSFEIFQPSKILFCSMALWLHSVFTWKMPAICYWLIIVIAFVRFPVVRCQRVVLFQKYNFSVIYLLRFEICFWCEGLSFLQFGRIRIVFRSNRCAIEVGSQQYLLSNWSCGVSVTSYIQFYARSGLPSFPPSRCPVARCGCGAEPYACYMLGFVRFSVNPYGLDEIMDETG